ncbi:poly-gamma-glutamate hydrolase family protein [Streptomyces sp. NPDC001985]|uniref:poly-gamma-glutamate hydrolase family protein n=1 Tax=Streptomyces sp. NPDC001985 TaxID=3154406 RepID=UPI003325284B
MTEASRRTILTAFATAAVGTTALAETATAAPGTAHATGAVAAPAAVAEPESHTEIYTNTALVEGRDYSRRFRRADPNLAPHFTRTTVMAIHGGGIEPGTSELCLGIAGFHTSPVAPAGRDGLPLHDYWMFEGRKTSGNADAFHVTSSKADDRVALSMAGSSLNVVSVHGCDWQGVTTPDNKQAVVVGGLNVPFKNLLKAQLTAAGFQVIDGAGTNLAGEQPNNICNRTILRMGAQLELTGELRAAMFTVNTGAGRATSTTQVFHDFVAATRKAIHLQEQAPEQIVH